MMTPALKSPHLTERRIGWLLGAVILFCSYAFLLGYTATSWNQELTAGHAHAIAAAFVDAWTSGSERGSLQAVAAELHHLDARLSRAFVYADGAFLLHPDPARAGSRLDPASKDDKAVYDASQQLKSLGKRSDQPAQFILSWAESGAELTLYEPLLESGRLRGAVRVDYKLDQSIPLAGWAQPMLLLVFAFAAYWFAAKWSNHPQWAVGGILLLALTGLMFGMNARRNTTAANRIAELKLESAATAAAALTKAGYDSAGYFQRLVSDTQPGRIFINEFSRIRTGQPEAPSADRTATGRVVGSAHAGFQLQGSVDEGQTQTNIGVLRKPFIRLLPPMLLIAFILWMYVSTGKAVSTGRALVHHRVAYIYIFPAGLGLIVLVFFPLLYGVALAFFKVLYGEWTFVGFKNFVEVLSNTRVTTPGSFYYTFGVTVMWTAINVVLHVTIGLTLALTLNRATLRWKKMYRVLLILPWAIPNYITALIWKGMFHRQFGAINAFLQLVGIEPVSWFNSFWTAFFANVLTNTWLGFPFMMVISLGALQSIPAELYEAAEVDGASKYQKLRTITLPLLKPTLFPAIILGTVWTFNMFNIIYLVSGGAPNGSTDILIVEAYRYAFQRSAWGIAAAYAIIIFFILWLYSVITNRLVKATEGAL